MKLKRCPKCGSEGMKLFESEDKLVSIMCKKCGFVYHQHPFVRSVIVAN